MRTFIYEGAGGVVCRAPKPKPFLRVSRPDSTDLCSINSAIELIRLSKRGPRPPLYDYLLHTSWQVMKAPVSHHVLPSPFINLHYPAILHTQLVKERRSLFLDIFNRYCCHRTGILAAAFPKRTAGISPFSAAIKPMSFRFPAPGLNPAFSPCFL